MLDDQDEFEHKEVLVMEEADKFVRSVLFMLVPSVLFWVGLVVVIKKLT